MKYYCITNRTICQTEQFQFAVLNNSRIYWYLPTVPNHYNLEHLCLAKKMASTVAKLPIPNCGNCKNTAIWNKPCYLEYNLGIVLNLLNLTGLLAL